VYMGHVIHRGELKIGPSKIDVVLKWPTLTNVIKLGDFWEIPNIYEKSMSFSAMATPLHAMTNNGKSF
jgi:hypothetical protein